MTFTPNDDGTLSATFTLAGEKVGTPYIIGVNTAKNIKKIQLYTPHDAANRLIVIDNLQILEQL